MTTIAKTTKSSMQTIGMGEAYSNFINSINSDITRRAYDTNFSHFMKYCGTAIATHQDMLLISVSELESKIRDYIVHLRHDRRLSPGTVSSYLATV